MKTITQKNEPKPLHLLRFVLREIAPIIVPTLLFSGLLYCCFMEAASFPAV